MVVVNNDMIEENLGLFPTVRRTNQATGSQDPVEIVLLERSFTSPIQLNVKPQKTEIPGLMPAKLGNIEHDQENSLRIFKIKISHTKLLIVFSY